MAEPPPTHNLAWTKADYDKYMAEHTRTPGDAKWDTQARGNGKNAQAIEVHDHSIRPASKTTSNQAARQKRYRERKKET